MKLYGAIASPYVARVVMFARLKGMDIELVDAPGGTRSDEYKAITPIAKIPALEVDGTVIPESEVICEYLEDISPTPSGLPADALGRATSRSISRIVDLYIVPHAGGMLRQVNPATRDDAKVAEAKEAFEKAFGYLEHFMGEGPFAVGTEPTLGDCALGPYMIMLKQLVFDNFPEIEDPTEGDGRLAVWWTAMQAHDVCRTTNDEYGEAFGGFIKYLLSRVA